MQDAGKFLIITGIIIVAVGALLFITGKIPWIGKLPGDIVVQRKNFTFYFPLATSILLSIIISLILWFLGRR